MGRHALRLAIIMFCMWHMFATAVYVIPDQANDPVARFFRGTFAPHVRSYVLATSQWQKWDIFSPDPLRRVSSYFIDINRNDTWEPVRHYHFRSLPWWKRAKELKILRRVEEHGEHSAQAYLAFVCRQDIVPPGSLVRLRISYYVIPSGKELKEIGGWQRYVREYHEYVIAEHYCPLRT